MAKKRNVEVEGTHKELWTTHHQKYLSLSALTPSIIAMTVNPGSNSSKGKVIRLTAAFNLFFSGTFSDIFLLLLKTNCLIIKGLVLLPAFFSNFVPDMPNQIFQISNKSWQSIWPNLFVALNTLFKLISTVTLRSVSYHSDIPVFRFA